MKELAYRPDCTFTIAQFTDTHLQDEIPADAETYTLMECVVAWDRPDLIVLSGDIVHPTWAKDPSATWRRLIRFLDATAIPWTFVYGNHDAQEWSRDAIDGLLAEGERCLYEPGPANIYGRGNQAIAIVRTGRAESIGAIVWGIDSGMDDGPEKVSWGYTHADQVAWFVVESDRLTREAPEPVTGLLYQHNPVPHYDVVWETRECTGHKYEKVCMQDRDEGLFGAMRDRIDGCFVGHDHINDYEGTLDGVVLGYGRCTGYNCYGAEGFQRGARIVRLAEGVRGFTSAIRLADGSFAPRLVHRPGEPVVAPKGTKRAAEIQVGG